MTTPFHPYQFLIVAPAGWLNRHQQAVIDYLIEENRVLKEQLKGRRLAVKGKALRRHLLQEVSTLVTPDALLTWHRKLNPEYSYGFRPGRSAHQAVALAQRYVAAGYSHVVDIDLEQFFNRVNQDRLMSRVAERISDKRPLKLIRAFLKAGVMEKGLVRPVDEGTPQGGPLTPPTLLARHSQAQRHLIHVAPANDEAKARD